MAATFRKQRPRSGILGPVKTLFLTGGTGFIGAAFVPHALAAGYQVHALTRRPATLQPWIQKGVVPVEGDLLTPDAWRDIAARSDFVMHLAQPETFTRRITGARAREYRDLRLRMDTNLLDSLRPGTGQRICYVGGTSYIGHQGPELKDETAPPNPRGWGPYVAPAIESLRGHLARGLQIVEAFPGAVYGPGSWFGGYVLAPMKAGKPLISVKGPLLHTSPIHLEDCARALLHLMEHGEVGQRYFVVDDRPATLADLVQRAAQAMDVPLRVRTVPAWLARLFLGPVIEDSRKAEYRLSNARLHATGFAFQFPTFAEGVPDVVKRWQETQR